MQMEMLGGVHGVHGVSWTRGYAEDWSREMYGVWKGVHVTESFHLESMAMVERMQGKQFTTLMDVAMVVVSILLVSVDDQVSG